MTGLQSIAFFLFGFVTGIGATLFYMRWKMRKQLSSLEEQMDGLMDMTGELDDTEEGE